MEKSKEIIKALDEKYKNITGRGYGGLGRGL